MLPHAQYNSKTFTNIEDLTPLFRTKPLHMKTYNQEKKHTYQALRDWKVNSAIYEKTTRWPREYVWQRDVNQISEKLKIL